VAKFGEVFSRVFRQAFGQFKRRSLGKMPKNSSPVVGEKVLMFGWELPPFNSGGLGVACFELARSLTQFGVKVTFVLPQTQAIKIPFLKLLFADQGNLRVKSVKTKLHPYISSKLSKDDLTESEKERYSQELVSEVEGYGRRAVKIAKSEKFDIIHAHDWLSFPAGVEAKRATGKPLIVHVHATEFDRCGGECVDARIYEIEKRGLEAADKIIVVSDFTKRKIIKYYGISADKIEVVHNGLTSLDRKGKASLEAFKKTGYRVVLFLGRMTLQKGPDWFLKAAQKVLRVYPKVLFIMVGTGDMERQVIEEAAQMGISDRVLFTGYVKNEDLSRMYRTADLYVMPSVSEPFGIVALEALSYKTPVIISKQSGVAETVNHALKVDFWDTDEIANKINAILTHPSLRRCLKNYGEAEAKKNNWRKAALKCIGVYRSFASSK